MKIDLILEEIKRVDESGIRNMREWSKQYKTATLYFHQDLDGVTSACGIRKYLELYGIKVVKAIPINYGGNEFKAANPEPNTLAVMVDFAHGKPFLQIHTDHHDKQVGDVKGTTSTAFSKTPSNAEYISQEISPRDLFPPEDLKIISMVDSADFLKNNITPDQIMNAAFGYDRTISVERNRMMMGLVVNKLLLAYKGKSGFLADLAMEANPSLTSMYVTIKELAKKNGYKPSEEIITGNKSYVEAQKNKIQEKGKDVTKLKNGESTVWGTTLVQYGGGGMFNGYDRYTPFKNNPDVDYMIIGWPMGLIQVSRNPFKKGTNNIHLGDMAMGVMVKKWKSKMSSKQISLGTVKRVFEMDIKPGDAEAMGFKLEDLIAQFDHKSVKGVNLDDEGGYTTFIKSIMSKKYNQLSYKQKQYLDKITISLWDLITANSGGHKSISNISALNFYGKGYVDELLKPLMSDLSDEMMDKKLEDD